MGIAHYCRECGNQVEEFCEDHPEAIVESMLTEDGGENA